MEDIWTRTIRLFTDKKNEGNDFYARQVNMFHVKHFSLLLRVFQDRLIQLLLIDDLYDLVRNVSRETFLVFSVYEIKVAGLSSDLY